MNKERVKINVDCLLNNQVNEEKSNKKTEIKELKREGNIDKINYDETFQNRRSL